jgi:cytochrome c oxidase subunit I
LLTNIPSGGIGFSLCSYELSALYRHARRRIGFAPHAIEFPPHPPKPPQSLATRHSPLATSYLPLNFRPKCNVLSAAPGALVLSPAARGLSKTGMVTYDSGANAPETPQAGFYARHFFTPQHTNHKTIGLNYLWLALFSVFLGMIMSLVMRIHLVWPGVQLPLLSGLGNTPERYAALTMLHGSLMVFMVLTAAPQAGFGNYFLPIQIGARDMAFPTLNLLAFWATVASLFGMTAAFFLRADTSITLWVASVALFCAAALVNAVNFSVTTIDLRAQGMTLPRLPITVWAWFINAILSMLIFSILLAACACILFDRLIGAAFFVSPALPASLSGLAASYNGQRLFWFFAQAEVYVAMLPCFGIVTHLLATFSRKPIWRERTVVLALCAVGLFGFCVWGQHMFASGMNPYSPLVFSLLAASLGLPASILLMSWFGTLWNGRIQLTTAMLFAIGFVSLFLAGGISGLFLARQDLAAAAVSDDFIAGHFHLVMGVAATFAILGALFFWFPKMFGRRLNERLGKIHFWLTFAGVYCVFMPMHWLGLISHSRVSPGTPLAAVAAAGFSIRSFVTIAMLLTIAAQAVFLFNFVWSLLRGEKATQENPWRATTLEWSLPSPSPLENFAGYEPAVYRGAYEFNVPSLAEDFAPQHLPPVCGEPTPRSAQESGLDGRLVDGFQEGTA